MVIVFGPAGAGKTVQGKLLAAQKKWQWISAGQLLRNDSDPEILKIISAGGLVPGKKIEDLITDAFEKADDVDRIVLDGFPRQVEEADWFLKRSPFKDYLIDAIILIEINKEEIIKRLLLRARADDTPQAIAERLEIYHDKMKPVLDFFMKNGVRIIHIDGMGTIEQVHDRIIEELNKCKKLGKS